MTWGQWLSAATALVAGATLAISFYLHWSFRYTRPRLGLVSEIALFVLIVALAFWGVATLWEVRP